MRLPLVGGPAVLGRRRRRARPRPDAPRTIVPELTAEERAALRPANGPDDAAPAADAAAFDAARKRLKRDIGPLRD